MENLKECPVCGSQEIRQGQSGEGGLYPMKSILLNVPLFFWSRPNWSLQPEFP